MLAPRIILLEVGRVEIKGTYNELLERDGAFAAIASKLLWQNTIVTAKTIAKMPKLPE